MTTTRRKKSPRKKKPPKGYAQDVASDLVFLKELKDKVVRGFECDCVSRDYAIKMIDDWIDELSVLLEEP